MSAVPQIPPKTIHLQDLPRVNEIAVVMAGNGFGHLLGLMGLNAALSTHAEESTGPLARRLRQALVQLGPTFVKLGQILSVRPDILPKDVMAEFETLQDRVPPMGFEDVRQVVESELGLPLEEVFAEFDPIPLGSASIAQVHRARLVDGSEVAIKLQRKGIERTIRSDLHILYSLAQLLEGRIAIPGMHTPTAIVREFDAAITSELDFLQELKSAERMARYHAESEHIVVPKVFPRWSTRRLLVMELIDGIPLSQAMATLEGDKARKLAHAIMEATYQQVFEFGFFHGDPHPGNLFVTRDDKLAYLDFGVVGTLTGGMQDAILTTFTSMVFRDAETLALTIYRAGASGKTARVDLREFIAEIERKMAKYHGASLDDLANPTTFVEIVQMCTRFQISLPPEFAVLSRAIGLIEGEIRSLLPGTDIVEEVKPYAQRLMARRFSPDRVAVDMSKMLVQAQGHLRDIPTQFNQLVMDLENGNITVVTRDPDAAKLREEIRAAVLRLSLAAMASTVTMGALMFMAAWSPTPTSLQIPIFGLFGSMLLWLGAGLFGALGIHVLFAQFFDLGAWRRRVLGVVRFLSWRRDE
ncbi:MAG: AarF/ABC1/UbiB kinase family protein [Deltaproteobacteria bacterium]|nr:AarF/ABC1/UbiB kinase family protein [Deltaproteobacteria bacterium]